MSRITSICGIPISVVYNKDTDQTVIETRALTSFQQGLITGWLSHKGNVVVNETNTAFTVAGKLAPTTIKT